MIAMLKLLALAGLVTASACSLTTANRTALVISTAAIACDWSQTRSWNDIRWQGVYETNPLLGEMPQAGEIDAYFWIVSIANIAAWAISPPRYRWISQSVVVGLQAQAVIPNQMKINSRNDGRSLCGI